MRAQSVRRPFEPDYGAELFHPTLKRAAPVLELLHPAVKRAPTLSLPDFRKQANELKLRCQNQAQFLRSELRHLGSFIWEWFCVSFQI
jgi:hypothetical protein